MASYMSGDSIFDSKMNQMNQLSMNIRSDPALSINLQNQKESVNKRSNQTTLPNIVRDVISNTSRIQRNGKASNITGLRNSVATLDPIYERNEDNYIKSYDNSSLINRGTLSKKMTSPISYR